jgi:hypothetical protein
MKSETLRRMKLIRRDQGNLLFHFTRANGQNIASHVLDKIIREGRLIGSGNLIRGGHKCVCFTEAPITELHATFSLVELTSDQKDRVRYESFGVAVTKEWLFERGGRPVIYQSEKEFKTLPESLQYRHVRYEPNRDIDFTWEREWRIHCDELRLDPKETLVVVPTCEESYELMYGHSTLVDDGVNLDGGFVESVYPEPSWRAVSLDLFGVPNDIER